MKSEKLTNEKEVVRIINQSENFSLPETNEDRKQARYFKKLFNKRKNIGVCSFIIAIGGMILSYFAYIQKEPVLSFLEEKYTNSFAGNANLSIILITLTVLAVVTLQLSKPKLPTELSPEQERGLQLYLRNNNTDFTIRKIFIDGEVTRIKTGENSSIFVKYFSEEKELKDKEIEIPIGSMHVPENILAAPVRQRIIYIDYPKIGSVLANYKIIISRKLYEKDKLPLKDIDVLIKRDKSGKHYNIFVNQ